MEKAIVFHISYIWRWNGPAAEWVGEDDNDHNDHNSHNKALDKQQYHESESYPLDCVGERKLFLEK